MEGRVSMILEIMGLSDVWLMGSELVETHIVNKAQGHIFSSERPCQH